MDFDEEINRLKELLQDTKEFFEPIQNELLELNNQERLIKESYQAQMEKIRKARQNLDEKKYESQKKINEAQQKINQLTAEKLKAEAEAAKAKAEAEEAERRKKELEALSNSFEAKTLGAPWREMAKDHQIKAGHMIGLNRKVILADPMGLGKTLSAIITSDMAEKTTQDASPEWPFLGEEKSVYVPGHYAFTQTTHNLALNYLLTGELPAYGSWLKDITSKDGELFLQGKPFGKGKSMKNFFISESLQTLQDMGYVEYVEAHYENQIVNGIERPVGRKILYICPAPLLRNVMEEFQKWSPHRSVTFIGGMSKAEQNFVMDFTLPHLKEYVIVVNYEAWRRNTALLDKLISCRFDTVIIDEAHMIKDMKSAAFRGVKQLIDGLNPEYIIPMTGTPILNRPQELYPLLHLVNPEEFYHERDYLFKYCEEYETDDGQVKWKFREGGLDVLAKKISSNFLRRTREQAGIVLPEKSVIYHELDLDEAAYPEQAKARKHMKDYATLIIDENAGKAISATAVIALFTRLRQIETWPAGIVQRDPLTKEITLQVEIEESQKIDYIIRKEGNEWEGLIPDVVEDERVIVFSQFKAPLQELKKRIENAGFRAVILDGSTPATLRDEIRHDFDRSKNPDRANAKWDVLLANYKAGGTGLTLTNATQLITLDEEWNPGKRDQAWDRVYRIGQTESVTIHVIRTKNTIDTWLAGLIDDKEKIVDGFQSATLSGSDLKSAIENGLI